MAQVLRPTRTWHGNRRKLYKKFIEICDRIARDQAHPGYVQFFSDAQNTQLQILGTYAKSEIDAKS